MNIPHKVFYHICLNGFAPWNIRAARNLDRKYFKRDFPVNHILVQIQYNFTIVSRDTLHQNCTNGSAPANTGAARPLDKMFLTTSAPKPLVQIQNNFTELFLMIPFTKIAQMVAHHQTKGLLD